MTMTPLVERLRGQYECGPHLPNGKPEFGWRQFEAPPIQHEAAAYIERLKAALDDAINSPKGVVPDRAAEFWDGKLGRVQ